MPMSDWMMQRLVDEYRAWNQAQGLSLGSADEHLNDRTLTDAQRAWLADFSSRWDRADLGFEEHPGARHPW